jgi:hypothetical protein
MNTDVEPSLADLARNLELRERVNRNPYGAMGVAVGVGYLLAGGLFTPLTGRLLGLGLRIGMRLAIVPLIERELGTLVESLGVSPGESANVGPEHADRGHPDHAKGADKNGEKARHARAKS